MHTRAREFNCVGAHARTHTCTTYERASEGRTLVAPMISQPWPCTAKRIATHASYLRSAFTYHTCVSYTSTPNSASIRKCDTHVSYARIMHTHYGRSYVWLLSNYCTFWVCMVHRIVARAGRACARACVKHVCGCGDLNVAIAGHIGHACVVRIM